MALIVYGPGPAAKVAGSLHCADCPPSHARHCHTRAERRQGRAASMLRWPTLWRLYGREAGEWPIARRSDAIPTERAAKSQSSMRNAPDFPAAFGYRPNGTDGAWPAEPVRDL